MPPRRRSAAPTPEVPAGSSYRKVSWLSAVTVCCGYCSLLIVWSTFLRSQQQRSFFLTEGKDREVPATQNPMIKKKRPGLTWDVIRKKNNNIRL